MEKTINQFKQGLITEKELFGKLEKAYINGSFQSDSSFIGFDYRNQAWIKGYKYERCGHPESMDCGCFGRDHAGEPVILDQDKNRFKKGSRVLYNGQEYLLAFDVKDETVCIEYAYQSGGGHIFPVYKYVNIDETDLLEDL